MATTTFSQDLAGTTAAERKSGALVSSGFLKRMFEGFIAAREAEARRRVAVYLSTYTDKDLVNAGLSARDIELLRTPGAAKVDLAG